MTSSLIFLWDWFQNKKKQRNNESFLEGLQKGQKVTRKGQQGAFLSLMYAELLC